MNKIYLKSIFTGAALLLAFSMVLGLTTGFLAVVGNLGGALNPPTSDSTWIDIYYWYIPITAIGCLIVGGLLGGLVALYHNDQKAWLRAATIVLGILWLATTWWLNFGIPLVALGLLLALAYTLMALRAQFKPHTSVKALLHGALVAPVLLVGSFSTTAAIYWTLPSHVPADLIYLSGVSLLCPGVGIILGSIFGAIEAYGHRHIPSKVAIITLFTCLVIWAAYQAIGFLSFGLLPGLLLTAWILAKAKHRIIKSLLVGGFSLSLLSTTVMSINSAGLVSRFSSGQITLTIAVAFMAGLILAGLFIWAYRFNRHNLAWMISLALGLVIGLFGSWQGLIALLLAITFTMWAIKFSYDSVKAS
ncbi:MAG: hypothetical protein K0Q57_954 [Gammaproteobacteria bacterium]|jgi:hypothetical protein|nr:hypothetical protein [Gammaproteobacteria bacterium]